MKSILLISLFSILIANILAAVSIGIFEDPKHPGKCVVKGFVLSPDEEAQVPGICEKIVCHEKSHASFYSCGAIGAPPGHKLGEPINASAPYPDCCERHFVPI